MKSIISIFISLLAIQVIAQEDISFTSDVSSGCSPLEVTFTNNSTNTAAVNFEWNMGDGTSLTGEVITHTFQSAESYFVSMVAYSESWSYLGMAEATIEVTGIGDILVSNEAPCPGESILFGAPEGGTNYVWDFGDGNTGSGIEETHTYSAIGTYTVSLSADFTDCGNQTKTLELEVGAGQAGTPEIQVSATMVCPGDEIQFSTLTEGTEYLWEFGDGNTSSDQEPTHSYDGLGEYMVYLTITNVCGNQGIDSVKVTSGGESNWPEDLFLEANSNTACPRQEVIFEVTKGNYTYSYDFGDGSGEVSDASNQITYAFSEVGIYEVSVTLTDQCQSDTTLIITQNISTKNSFPTELELISSKDEICPGSIVTFNVTERYEWYVWDFGDGSDSDSTKATEVQHAYNMEGSYDAKVKIYSTCGGDSTLTKSISVSTDAELITEEIILQHDTVACPNSNVSFFLNDGFSQYEWSFGDGSDAVVTEGTRIDHTFSTNGEYTITGTVTNFCGDSKEVTSTIIISDNLNLPDGLLLEVSDSEVCPNTEVELFAEPGFKSYIWYQAGQPFDTTEASTNKVTLTEVGVTDFMVVIFNRFDKSDSLSNQITVSTDLPFEEEVELNQPDQVCPNESITFNATEGFNSYTWNFGDGTSTEGTNNATHTYIEEGDYEVTLTVTNQCSTDSTLTTTAVIRANSPIPDGTELLKDKDETCPGELVSFSASDGFELYRWNFGDDSQIIETEVSSINYAYVSDGIFNASVELFNACGNSATFSEEHLVTSESKLSGVFSIGASPSSACPGEEISFTGPSAFKNYYWQFGDGTVAEDSVSSGANYVYDEVGEYEVSLRFENQCGSDTTIFYNIVIANNAPFDQNLRLNVDREQACPGEKFGFEAPFGYSDYVWQFPVSFDESLFNGKNDVSFSFEEVGTYQVSVSFKNSCGNDKTLNTTVEVGSDFSEFSDLFVAADDAVCPGEDVVFQTKEGYINYFWDFGDGVRDTTTTYQVAHAYETTGLFSYTVTIVNGCGATSLLEGAVFIDNAITKDVFLDVPGETCPGERILINAGEGFLSYIWNVNGQTYNTSISTLDLVIDEIGAYEVNLTVVNFCGADSTISEIINIGTSNSSFDEFLELTSSAETLCPGDPVEFVVEGIGLDKFTWFVNGGTGIKTVNTFETSFENEGEQVIEVQVTNFCGRDTTLNQTVLVSSSFSGDKILEISGNKTNACPEEIITFEASNGFQSYVWSFGDGSSLETSSNTANHSYAALGGYVVSVDATDACGNQYSTAYVVDVDGNKDISEGLSLAISNTSICPGQESTFSVIGGGDFSAFNWEVAGSTYLTQTPSLTIEFSELGSYQIQVQVSDNCGNSASLSKSLVVGNNSPIPYIAFGIEGDEELAGCPGDILTFFFEGEYSNEWDFGDGTKLTAFNIVGNGQGGKRTIIQYQYELEGTYDVSLALENTCGNKDTLNTQIVIGSGIASEVSLNYSSPDNEVGYARCAPIEFTASGGSSFEWDFGDGTQLTSSSTTKSHSYSSAGTYQVSVKATNGCGVSTTRTASITIENQILPFIDLKSSQSPQCTSDVTGNLIVEATGYGPFQYEWIFEGVAGPQLNNIGVGDYTVFVTDRFGCTTQAVFDVVAESDLELSVTVSDASCGTPNGAISLSLQSTEGYSFLWSDGSTLSDRTDLGAGFYELQITDETTGCKENFQFELIEQTALTVSENISTPSCAGEANGSISLELTDDLGGETFLWSTGATTQNLDNIGAGSYQVTITDTNGCRTIKSYAVTEPNELNSTLDLVEASCLGEEGSANISVYGGTSPYNYEWSNGSSASSASDLSTGEHSVIVTDAVGCSITETFTINQSEGFTISSEIVNNTCFEDLNGAIEIFINGGIAPFTFDWSIGASSSIISGLSSGNYEVVVTDKKGCSSTATFEIGAEDKVAPDAFTKDITINLGEDGLFVLTADDIDDGSIDNCSIVTRTIDVTQFDCSFVGQVVPVTLLVEDSNGNSSSSDALVTIQDTTAPVVVTQDVSVTLDENGNASITVDQVENGSTDACGILEMSLDIEAFDCSQFGTVQIVTLSVTDVNGNVGTGTANVTIIDNEDSKVCTPLSVATVDKLRMYPNPSSDFVMIESTQNESVMIYNLKGDLVKQGMSNAKISILELEPGVYIVQSKEMQLKLVKD